MIILDTNVISEVVKPKPAVDVTRWLNRQRDADVFTTSVTLAELLVGISVLPDGRRKETLAAGIVGFVDERLAGNILPFDERAAEEYAAIFARAKSVGITISFADGQIAAIAAARGFAVTTRDVQPFEAAGIVVINPWAAEI